MDHYKIFVLEEKKPVTAKENQKPLSILPNRSISKLSPFFDRGHHADFYWGRDHHDRKPSSSSSGLSSFQKNALAAIFLVSLTLVLFRIKKDS